MGKALLVAAVLALLVAGPASAQDDLPTKDDPRFGLAPGLHDAGVAQEGMELLATRPNPPGFISTNPGSIGADIAVANSDLAFQGDYAFVGNFNGFNVYNIANPAAPVLAASVVCPGGQGDLSVYQNLLFMSVEEGRARTNCTQNTPPPAVPFLGVRIFDISNVANPVQVGAVQTCRGSHTHTLVEDDSDPNSVYIYVSGTAGNVRTNAPELGCEGPNSPLPAPATGNPSRWRIDVIRVPLAAPQNAAIVNQPRLFRNEQTGAIAGLQNAPSTPEHPCAPATPPRSGCNINPNVPGTTWSPAPVTDACHDITVYEELDIAAGACEGNGLLIDISDPANPRRIDAVSDPNYAYWHGATFTNDGKSVMFTDEWGGGTAARCREADDLDWGGNSIYDIVDGELEFRGYYKLPVAQSDQENCVSHIPSLIPVPGRDLVVQAWYQGGASLVDFEDGEDAFEIGYYDRGPLPNPLNPTALRLGGLWSTYWYNGVTFGSEIVRGLDVWGLTPNEHLSANEIAAAREVRWDRLNVQTQKEITWEPSFNVVRSYRDQLVREGNIDAETLQQVDKFIDRAEAYEERGKSSAASAQLDALSQQLKGNADFDELRGGLDDLSDAL
jgi:hypothetical protein